MLSAGAYPLTKNDNLDQMAEPMAEPKAANLQLVAKWK